MIEDDRKWLAARGWVECGSCGAVLPENELAEHDCATFLGGE
jgi:hypothetical protein